jgi:cysteinyl-tRNA synthetase
MLRFFNTLTNKKEQFASLHKGEARLYHCGPTVYNFAHIGNLRAYVFADVLRRTLEYGGYRVTQVINITDIGHLSSDADEGEDKMVKGLQREGLPLTMEGMNALADKYEAAFRTDLAALNIKTDGTHFPRASAHIAEEVEIIQKLEQKGIAYKTSDGIYFDTTRFPSYGTRGGFKLGELKAGARVGVNVEKRTACDFALWKFAKGELGFPSPWGVGFPGWHIECSAMSRKYLDQPFDIHTGGIDHIPVHHQNEIAQSEAAYNTPLAHYWLHSAFVNVSGGEKMAKSEENFLTLRSLTEKGIHPLAYRYWLLTAHYRSPLTFSWAALQAAQNAYFKILLAFSQWSHTRRVGKKVADIVSDDLDTPALLAKLHTALKERDVMAVLDVDRIVGLDIENEARKLQKEINAVPEEIKEKAVRRETARARKDFATADALREEIRSAGYEIMDTDEESVVRKKLQ